MLSGATSYVIRVVILPHHPLVCIFMNSFLMQPSCSGPGAAKTYFVITKHHVAQSSQIIFGLFHLFTEEASISLLASLHGLEQTSEICFSKKESP